MTSSQLTSLGAYGARLLVPAVTSVIKRGFHTNRQVTVQDVAEEQDLSGQMKNLCRQLEELNAHLKVLEEKSFAPRRVRVAQRSLDPERIVDCIYRESLCYVEYPYVVILKHERENYSQYQSNPVEAIDIPCRDELTAQNLVREVRSQCSHLKDKV